MRNSKRNLNEEEKDMARKPLGKDRFGVQKVMRGGDYFADSMGM